MMHFLNSLEYPGKDPSVVHAPDPLIVGKSVHVHHGKDETLTKAMHPALRNKKDKE